MPQDARPVLVVSDGRQRDADMLELAAREAVARDVPLAVASVSTQVVDPRFSLTAMLAEERRDADVRDFRLRAAVAALSERHPSLTITTHRLRDQTLGWPDDATGDLSDASLLVIPDRGPYDQPVFATGSASRYLLKSTSCPVLVVPEDAPVADSGPGSGGAGGPVVAAVGEDPLAGPVLEAARQEATSREATLLVVHAYRARPGEAAEQARERAEALCRELVPDAGSGRVETLVTDSPVVDLLLERGREAGLLVLGTRGPAALAGFSPESVCRAVLDDAPCPVLVVLPRTARPVRRRQAAGRPA